VTFSETPLVFRTSNSRLFPKHQTSNSILFGNIKQVIQDMLDLVSVRTIKGRSIDTTQYLTIRFPSAKITYYGLRIPKYQSISEYRRCRAFTLCLGTETPAPVTGAAGDEYNLCNVVDCNASVTVARPAVLNLSQWGSGGNRDPQPPEANVCVT